MAARRTPPERSGPPPKEEPWDESIPAKGATSPDGPGRETTPPGVPAPWEESDIVLNEISRIESALTPRRGSSAPPTAPSPVPPSRGRVGAFNPYLAERVEMAQRAASRLLLELSQTDPDPEVVDGAIASVRTELEQAHREFQFLRTGGSPADETSPPRAATGSPPFSPPLPGTEVFAGFTSARYNRAVGRLQSGRRRLLSLTVIGSAVISGALLTLTLIAREPNPALGLRLLPLVWLVPVPFFLLAFRGTYRLLSHQPFGVAEVT